MRGCRSSGAWKPGDGHFYRHFAPPALRPEAIELTNHGESNDRPDLYRNHGSFFPALARLCAGV